MIKKKVAVKYWSDYTLLFYASYRISGRTKLYRWRQWAFSLKDPGEMTKLILAERDIGVQGEGTNNNTD